MNTKMKLILLLLAISPMSLLANSGLAGLEVIVDILIVYFIFTLIIFLLSWVIAFKGRTVFKIIAVILNTLLLILNLFTYGFLYLFDWMQLAIPMMLGQGVLILFLIFSLRKKHEKS